MHMAHNMKSSVNHTYLQAARGALLTCCDALAEKLPACHNQTLRGGAGCACRLLFATRNLYATTLPPLP